MMDWLQQFLQAFIPLFVAIDPIGLAAIFLAMGQNTAPDARKRIANQAVWTAGLVALGLFNSVVSAFYYVRVLKAIYLREPSGTRLQPPRSAIALPVLLSAVVVTAFGIAPAPLVNLMKSASTPMLTAAQPASETTPLLKESPPAPAVVPTPVGSPAPAPAAASAPPPSGSGQSG